MHSRVFHVEQDIDYEHDNDLSEKLFDNRFVGTIADYVNDLSELDETDKYNDSILWFTDYMSKTLGNLFVFDNKDKSFEFSKGFKQKWFKERYEDFKDAADDITLDDFAGNDILIYKIKNMLDEKYGFYIYSEDNSYETIDSFIRCEAKEHTKYYIKDIADYHC